MPCNDGYRGMDSDNRHMRLGAEALCTWLREVEKAGGAYKSIDMVMNDARELVVPTHVLTQMISVKGD